MRTIPLTQGHVALVDDEDYERVNQFKWYAVFNAGHGYATRTTPRDANGRRTQILMHRFVMGLEYGDPPEVDHKDRVNTLDNRKSNLRVTLGQNSQNRGLHRNNTSKFKGVSWLKAKEKWRAQIRVENNDIWLGLFSSPELAARAYDAAALKYHGSFACTNEMLGLLEPVSLGMAA
jgi:hypothetical protein